MKLYSLILVSMNLSIVGILLFTILGSLRAVGAAL